MPEEFQQIKTQVITNAVPIAVGGAAILLVAVGIYLFSSRQTPKQQVLPKQAVVETPIDLSAGQPAAVSPLAGFASPTPVQAPTPTPITKSTVKKLPKSGFPALALVPASLALIGSGFLLRRKN